MNLRICLTFCTLLPRCRRCRRVDDQAGPLLMALMFVVCMAAIMLVNVADLVLLLKYAAKHHGGDGDDPGGGQGPW